jgi:hypothetical protein
MSEFVWRYTKTGRVTHALIARIGGTDRIALCGVSPPLFKPFWFGGTEAEQAKAQRMRRCTRCDHYVWRVERAWPPVTS